jgi:hypothetical protein
LVAEGEVGYVEFFDVVSSRRSVRTFTNDPITEDQLNTILEAVNAAPSAGNLQAFEVVVVRDDSTKKKIAKAAWGQNFIAEAPVCLVFLANPRRSEHEYGVRGRELYCIQDATIAAEHAHLSCVPLGLSSVWVGAYSEEAVAEAVSAPPYMCCGGTSPAGPKPIASGRGRIGPPPSRAKAYARSFALDFAPGLIQYFRGLGVANRLSARTFRSSIVLSLARAWKWCLRIDGKCPPGVT